MHTLELAGASGTTLFADAWGAPSGPPVVLLHGGGQTRHAWSSTAEVLAADGCYALSVDQRGHGDNAHLGQPEAYEDERYRDDVAAIVRGLGRPTVLVGASLGGIASLLAAGEIPDLDVRGIVFVDVTPRLVRDGVARILGFMSAAPDGFDSLEAAADAIAAYLPHRPRPTDLSGLRKNLRQHDDGRWRWHWDPVLLDTWSPARWSAGRRDAEIARRLDAARALTCPVLLVRGRQSDVVGTEQAEEFLRVVPHATYVDLAGARHMVAGDRNDAFTRTVRTWISGLAPLERGDRRGAG